MDETAWVSDDLTQNAVVRNLEVIDEAVKRSSGCRLTFAKQTRAFHGKTSPDCEIS